MKIALKVFSGLISFILVFLLIVSLYIMISSRITGNQPSIFGNQLMLVLSGSMEPNIQTGSVVGVKPVNDKKLIKKGDIITFYSPIQKDRIITHRIVDRKVNGQFTEYITKGDNNQSKDPMPVSSDNIIGKYSNIQIPYAGYILGFLQSKKGIALSLILPGILLIAYNVFTLWKIFRTLDPSKKVSTDNPSW